MKFLKDHKYIYLKVKTQKISGKTKKKRNKEKIFRWSISRWLFFSRCLDYMRNFHHIQVQAN